MMEEMFTIGKIVNTHGIKGELRVIPSTDDITRFERLDKVYIDRKDIMQYEIENVRYHKNFVLLKLKGIDNINEAEPLKNALLKIERKDTLPLEEDEYYISDLIDLEVITDEGRSLGKIVDIIATGSNDVYVVEKEDTSKQILIPAIKDVVKEVDIPNKKMIVKLLEGLEDL